VKRDRRPVLGWFIRHLKPSSWSSHNHDSRKGRGVQPLPGRVAVMRAAADRLRTHSPVRPCEPDRNSLPCPMTYSRRVA
jgi:hypothetical protein